MNLFSLNSPLARGINKLVQMLYAGVLWFLCSLPILTVGAATTALYEVLLKLEKDQENYIGRSFFHAFRRNLRSATLVWLPILLAEIVFGVNLLYYAIPGGGQFPVQCVVFTVLLLLTVIIHGYAFPSMARFENTTAQTFRFALMLALRNPGWTAVIVILQLAAVFVCWFFLWFPVVFGMGIVGYMQAAIFNRIFDRLIEQGEITEIDGTEKKEQEDGE